MMSARRLRRLLLACGLSLACAPAAWAQYAQVPADEAGFTAYAGRELVALRPGAQVSVHAPLVLDFTAPGRPAPSQVALDHVWQYCRASPATCAPALHRFLTAAAETAAAEAAPVRAEQLRLVLRVADYATEARAKLEAAHRQALARPVAGDLWAFVVVDLPHSTRLLTAQDLPALALDEDAAFSLALRQTEATLKPLDQAEHDVLRRHIGYVAGDAYYEAARFVDHAAWKPVADRMNGHLLITVPDSGMIFFGDDRERGMVANLHDIATHEIAKSVRPLTPTVFAWTETGWRVVPPPQAAPMPAHPETGPSAR
jgi:hypothetical protein